MEICAPLQKNRDMNLIPLVSSDPSWMLNDSSSSYLCFSLPHIDVNKKYLSLVIRVYLVIGLNNSQRSITPKKTMNEMTELNMNFCAFVKKVNAAIPIVKKEAHISSLRIMFR